MYSSNNLKWSLYKWVVKSEKDIRKIKSGVISSVWDESPVTIARYKDHMSFNAAVAFQITTSLAIIVRDQEKMSLIQNSL
ncbi:hypothetical protein [Acinetobacter oleivorans]|jgi:hypothetical protein|uniref:hypothetical protein n=1 Tax=Acinetobacter oleivorans TaxID=1148157 RepID=UPI0012500DFD|nr:hypothetical protein [Acinetobacter oleivorans]